MHELATKVELPRQAYKLKVLEAERSISALRTDEKTGKQTGNNPMITVKMEIMDAAPVQYNNPETNEIEPVDINGLRVTKWVTLTEKALAFANETKRALGMEKATKETISLEEANTYVGKVGWAILQGKQRVIKDSSGQPIINPHTNKPVTQSEIDFVMWLAPGN